MPEIPIKTYLQATTDALQIIPIRCCARFTLHNFK